MGRRKLVGLWIVLGLLAFIVLLAVGVQVAVNTRYVKNTVNKVLASAVDGEVNYDRLDISLLRSFPILRVTLDTVSLTYDHSKFAQWDGVGVSDTLLSAGRGSAKDTLARFDRFSAAVNLPGLISGRLRLKDARIDNLDAFLHFYDSTASNLDIFISDGKKDKKDSLKDSSVPPISVGKICLSDLGAVYTDQSSGVFAKAMMDRLGVSGSLRFLNDGGVRVRKVMLDIDALEADARVPSNSAHAYVDRLFLHETSRNTYDLGLWLDAVARTEAFGRLEVPVDLEGLVGFDMSKTSTDIDVDHLDGRLAYIPLHIEGNARMYPDSTLLDASMAVTDCPLDTLLNEYAVKFIDAAKQVRTDARMNLAAEAKGVLATGRIPQVSASVDIPRSRLAYLPLGVDGSIVLDADGTISPEKVIDATLNELKALLPGIDLKASGYGKNITGGDPAFSADADLAADLNSVMAFLPEKLGLAASGNIDLHADATGRLSYFRNLKFPDGHLQATLTGDDVKVSIPKDTLNVDLRRPDVRVGLDPEGLSASLLSDATHFVKGAGMEARARKMKNYAVMKMTESRGQKVPFADVDHNSDIISFRTGNNWFMASDVDLCVSARKRPAPPKMNRPRDGRGPGSGRMRFDSLAVRRTASSRADIDISLDSSITRYLRQWEPAFDVHVRRGTAAMPVLPLRTSLSGFQASFDGDVLQVDSLSATMGSSRVAARGTVSGLRRSLMRRGRIATDFYFHSRRVNVNELVAAFNKGKENDASAKMYAEGDESFIVDSLSDASLDKSGIPFIELPSNVDAKVKVLVDEVDYSDYVVRPFETNITLKDRKLQLSGTKVNTDLGDIALEAFYSTPDRKDISAGVDLEVYGVSADSLIKLIPSVDELMPALKSFKGKLNCEASALTQLDTNMNVLIPTLEGVVHINGQNLNVDDAGGLKKITRLLLFRNPNIGHIDDLDVNAVIHDSKVDVFPFLLGVDRYRLALHGMQGLDKTMYYHASVLKSPFLIRFGINVFGSFDKWSFNIGLPKYREGNVPVFSQQIDTMRVNIANTIRNVFETSLEDIRNHNADRELNARARQIGYEGAVAETSLEESVSAEQLAFELDAMMEEEALTAEVDAVLEESFRDIEAVMGDYEEQIYDKRILRKMERLERKKEKQAAKKNSLA